MADTIQNENEEKKIKVKAPVMAKKNKQHQTPNCDISVTSAAADLKIVLKIWCSYDKNRKFPREKCPVGHLKTVCNVYSTATVITASEKPTRPRPTKPTFERPSTASTQQTSTPASQTTTSSSTTIIIAVMGGTIVLLVLIIITGLFWMKRRTEVEVAGSREEVEAAPEVWRVPQARAARKAEEKVEETQEEESYASGYEYEEGQYYQG